MATTLESLRNEIMSSIHGRRLGLDKDGYLIGHKDFRIPVNAATSDTTGTVINGYGWTSITTTTDDTWLLGYPVPGAFCYLHTGTTSTGIRTIVRRDATFAIQTSAASTITTIVAQGGGITLTLFGKSTSLFALVSTQQSTEVALNGTT